MNIVSASALAGLAALVTIWVLGTDGTTPVPSTSPRADRSTFMQGRSTLLAADGTCETRSDVGGSLLGNSVADLEALADSEPDGAGTQEQDRPAAAALEAAMNAPIAGTCGGHPPKGEVDAGVAMAEVMADEPSQEQAVADEPDVAMTGPAFDPKPEPAAQTSPKPRRVQLPKERLTAWWPAPKADALNVLFVGEASFGSAISVLTDGRFESADSANAYIEVRNRDGTAVNRRWQLATNRQMLLLLVKPGVYTVSIQPELTDAQGRQAGSASRGQVYVR